MQVSEGLHGCFHHLIGSNLVPVLHVQQASKLAACPVNAALDRAHGDALGGSHFLVSQTLDSNQQEGFPPPARETSQGQAQLVHLQTSLLRRWDAQSSGVCLTRVFDLVFALAVLRIEAVTQDSEQPCFKVGAALEVTEVSPGPQDRILHQIISPDRIVGQRERQGTQDREQAEHLLAQPSSLTLLPGAMGRTSVLDQDELLCVSCR